MGESVGRWLFSVAPNQGRDWIIDATGVVLEVRARVSPGQGQAWGAWTVV